ncbi:cyclic AMP-dependent transcription factor ATF-3, putative [Ixodes scapularis]|uniref:Cyclic AMP-dependent transcription factor ATF-3, putative n=1 Tax=Ixodes scapularis TaxID=6945 RepID=B7QLP3_IXOSC|nr:cyclic AMP-dependent transcription factor ATF-3, putative [Ixodes scapularis]|eukprot:XP_002416098.1 cyclic AMP-dependent transcription factor ATF-3, putative [Ixodes scapularis]
MESPRNTTRTTAAHNDARVDIWKATYGGFIKDGRSGVSGFPTNAPPDGLDRNLLCALATASGIAVSASGTPPKNAQSLCNGDAGNSAVSGGRRPTSESTGTGLTQEDEEKRSKRRERNKIAASKCRNRKKERTVRLSEESEDLQRGNAELRRELQRLRQEVQHLSHLLRVHVCIAPGASGSR